MAIVQYKKQGKTPIRLVMKNKTRCIYDYNGNKKGFACLKMNLELHSGKLPTRRVYFDIVPEYEYARHGKEYHQLGEDVKKDFICEMPLAELAIFVELAKSLNPRPLDMAKFKKKKTVKTFCQELWEKYQIKKIPKKQPHGWQGENE